MIKEHTKIKTKRIDWEQRRYEISKAMLPELHNSYAGSTDWQCQQAVAFADKLINELQKQTTENHH